VDYVVGSTSFAGNAIPGIPSQQLQAFVTSRWRGTFATLESRMASEVAANDAGTVSAPGYAVWAVRGGFAPAPASWAARGDILFGVENLFDRRYASSVVTNATRGRYYEPGMGRNAYLGVRLDWSTR
jgi:iron complex outermembrane recepter protein